MAYTVNRKFLPLKLFFFSFIGAYISLFPFLPVFYKSLGLTYTQTSILYGTMPFVGFVSRILFGALADKYRKHKQLLIVCVCVQMIMFDLMLIVPLVGFKRETSQRAVPCSTAECHNSSLSHHDCSLSCENKTSIPCETVNASSSSSSFSCDDSATCELTCDTRVSVLDNASIFCIMIMLSLVGTMFLNPIGSLQDTITHAVLGEQQRHTYGKQRLWGAFGGGVFAVLSGTIQHISSSRLETKFLPAFVLHFALSVFTVLCTIPNRVESETRKTENIVYNMFCVIKKPRIAVFLIVLFVCGLDHGVIEAFGFWYLEETLGATKIQFGVIILLMCCVEVPAWILASRVIAKIGHTNVFLIVLLTYVIRLTGYSVIPLAWLSLIFDVGHSITFGLLYSAAVHYGTLIAPPGMEATMQNVISGVHFGLGRGIGGLIAGVIYSAAGPIVMLRSYALLTLVVALFCIIYFYFSIKCAKAVPKETDAKTAERLLAEDGHAEDGLAVPSTREEHEMTRESPS